MRWDEEDDEVSEDSMSEAEYVATLKEAEARLQQAILAVSFPWWKRLALKIPFLRKECPFGNLHLRWDRLCSCGAAQVLADEDGNLVWHCGVYDFRNQVELQPCAHCKPAFGFINHQWALTPEEEALLSSWRMYRQSTLDSFGESLPYEYKISVRLNGIEEALMTRTQGLAALQDTLPWMVRGAGEGGKPN